MSYCRREGVTHISLPLFLVSLARDQKVPEVFKLILFNIVVKVEGYRSQNRLAQCYSYQHFGHFWVHCR
jgi:hypothetical protein